MESFVSFFSVNQVYANDHPILLLSFILFRWFSYVLLYPSEGNLFVFTLQVLYNMFSANLVSYFQFSGTFHETIVPKL